MNPAIEGPGAAELQHLHAELQLVLEQVDQGFLTLRRDGAIEGQYSAAVVRWLGPYRAGTSFWDYLGTIDRRAGAAFEIGWEQILQDELPLELLLEQLPQRVEAHDRVVGLSYRPLLTDGCLVRLLVVVSDITDRIERERSQAEHRELVTVFEKIVQNKTVFLEFFDEANEIVRLVTDDQMRPPLSVVRRHIHTLKGNCGLFGLVTVQELCHRLETQMSERDGDLSAEERESLLCRWRRLAKLLVSLFGKNDPNRIEIDRTEYAAVLRAIERGLPNEQIGVMIAAWSLEPLQARLDYLATYARDLARRLRKEPLQVRVESHRLRVSPDRFGGFLASLVHVVANAVDHGIEPAEERRRAGKSEAATLALRAYLQPELFVLEISDDGRGIPWEALAARARSAGLPAETRAHLIEALFCEGISSRDQVCQISGRGIGMSAVRGACQALGGQIKLASQPGRGTTFQFRFPVPQGTATEERAAVLSPVLPPPGLA